MTENTQSRNVGTVRRYFQLQEHQDLETWLTLWADDGAQAIPYAPAGYPKLVEGPAELVAGGTYDNDLIGLFEFDGTGKLRLLTEYFDPTAFSAVT